MGLSGRGELLNIGIFYGYGIQQADGDSSGVLLFTHSEVLLPARYDQDVVQ